MDGQDHNPFLQDVISGLALKQKAVPSRWLYDARGSSLFDAITQLPEYYPTRTELSILRENASSMAEAVGPEAVMVEYGVGNLLDHDIYRFLALRRQDLGAGSCFIIGLDQPKSPDILIPAYDDAEGVTAAFNLNLLKRINRELGGDFDLGAFEHEARWNEAESRIEMHLRSLRRQSVTVSGRRFDFEEGETIHTENSRKISLERFSHMAESTGWSLTRTWMDAEELFAVFLLEAD